MTDPRAGKVGESPLKTTLKVVAVFLFLYVFLLGIGGLGAALKMMGKDTAMAFLKDTRGPFLSLMIGILATTLVQSSSMTTATLVGLVGAGALPLEQAAFMVMGANVGTTVTNTLVSLGHITRSAEYKRAFAAATVHDFFNLLTLVVLFPLEVMTGFLTHMADYAVEGLNHLFGARDAALMEKFGGPVKAVTKPVINELKHLVDGNAVVLLIISAVLLFGGLLLMVRTLRGLMLDKLSQLFDRVLFKTPLRSLMFGMLLTFLVQSSSISTSVAVPLVGAGVLKIRQVFPYTLGANIGTTLTAVLASTGVENVGGLTLALHHVFFNIVGVALFWGFREVPIRIAEGFAELSMRNRFLPMIYIVGTFYLLPFLLILLLG